MGDQTKELFDRILKNEIDLIFTYSSAILKPQSEIADKLYNLYTQVISNDLHHNYHINSMSLDEIEKSSIKPREIPSFNEFITYKLSNKNDKHSQLLRNNQEKLLDLGVSGYEMSCIRFSDNLELICQTAKTIAKHITAHSYSLADNEVEKLMERFSDFYPKYKNIFEAKPEFLGFSLDLLALKENISTWFQSKKNSAK